MRKELKAALTYRNDFHFSVIPVNVYWNEDEQKLEKKPYVSWTEFQDRIATEEELKEWWKKFPEARVGIVTGKLSDLFIVDLDSDEAREEFEKIVPETLQTPIAFTPRGGHHYYFRHVDGFPNRANYIPGLDIRTQGGFIVAPPSQGNGDGKQWVWSVDNHPKDISFAPLTDSIISFLKKSISLNSYSNSLYKDTYVKCKEEKQQAITPITNTYMEGSRDDDLYHAGTLMFRGRGELSFIRKSLIMLAKQCDPPFPENEIDTKIDSILKRAARKTRKIAEDIREWASLQKGYFSLTSCLQDLQILTKEDKNAAYVAVKRLEADGIIEKYGDQRGVYRPVQVFDDEEITFIEDKIPEFNVKLPIGLNSLCSIYAKNIIVVAGTKSAGKTALLLNIAHANQNIHDVVYLNSEMGAEEFSTRMKKMGVFRKEEIKFKFYSRAGNFHDRITGEKKIFIVDYIEQHENFSEIAIPIRKIHEKLKDGICILAIQKKSGERYGRGGEFSMEKARLYLTLEYVESMRATKVEIIDAKAPKVPDGARGMFRYIKVHETSTIKEIPGEDWKR